MRRIPVIAGAATYDVVVGPIGQAREQLAALGDLILVSEPKVFALHGERIAALLGCAPPILLPEGEPAKQWDVLHDLLAKLAQRAASRSTTIVALGGGSVGDVAGLAASLFKRGCPIVHLPTTLLAQADSAVGGKTAIDAFGEKNVIGSFHQPALVIADPAFLVTLDPRQLRSGYAEIVKYGLIDDPAFFAWCLANGPALIAGDPALREHAIATAVTAKARLIAGDVEDRSGRRALLNLGHSFAHAIESEAGLGTLLHGEAVALGLVLALRFSAALGHCDSADADRLAAHFTDLGLPTTLDQVGVGGPDLLKWIARDKKNEGAALTLILTRGVGKAFVARDVEAERLAAFLASSR
ncbi:MAG: 3-dehydroquinate synthase [Sphingomonas bacterium]|nr:3-dehydroquinate synthase [Sphingomonas bacterium]